jgi:hypothetical protein
MKTLYQSRFASATEDYILPLAGEIDQVVFPWFAASRSIYAVWFRAVGQSILRTPLAGGRARISE